MSDERFKIAVMGLCLRHQRAENGDTAVMAHQKLGHTEGDQHTAGLFGFGNDIE